MLYKSEIKIKVFSSFDLNRFELELNDWVKKDVVLVKDIQATNQKGLFVWVVLYHEQDKLMEVKK